MSDFVDTLTETRFRNMIRFAFHFNRHMGIKIEDMDSSYILDKWQSYFGDSTPPVITEEFKQSYIVPKWCERWSNFDLVARQIQLIQSMQGRMSPRQIVDAFVGTVWDESRRDVPYNGLHAKVLKVLEGWEHAREDEMKTILRQIKINSVVE